MNGKTPEELDAEYQAVYDAWCRSECSLPVGHDGWCDPPLVLA